MIKFITSETNNVMVEEIMDYVNNYINKNSGSENEWQERDVSDYNIKHKYCNLLDLIACASKHQFISPDNSITAQGKMIRIKILIKIVLRKFMKWYMKDVIAQQMLFNKDVVECIKQELCIISEMDAEIVRLHKIIVDSGYVKDERKHNE